MMNSNNTLVFFPSEKKKKKCQKCGCESSHKDQYELWVNEKKLFFNTIPHYSKRQSNSYLFQCNFESLRKNVAYNYVIFKNENGQLFMDVVELNLFNIDAKYTKHACLGCLRMGTPIVLAGEIKKLGKRKFIWSLSSGTVQKWLARGSDLSKWQWQMIGQNLLEQMYTNIHRINPKMMAYTHSIKELEYNDQHFSLQPIHYPFYQ